VNKNGDVRKERLRKNGIKKKKEKNEGGTEPALGKRGGTKEGATIEGDNRGEMIRKKDTWGTLTKKARLGLPDLQGEGKKRRL